MCENTVGSSGTYSTNELIEKLKALEVGFSTADLRSSASFLRSVWIRMEELSKQAVTLIDDNYRLKMLATPAPIPVCQACGHGIRGDFCNCPCHSGWRK
jgi:UDP-N-acetylmuramyl pentapeptide synthase